MVQLQEDIKTDTKLRRELVDRLEQAKADLNQELLKLDKSLKVTGPSPQFMTFPIEHFLLFCLLRCHASYSNFLFHLRTKKKPMLLQQKNYFYKSMNQSNYVLRGIA